MDIQERNCTDATTVPWWEIANKHKQVVVDKYGLRNIHLYEKGEEWILYTPTAKMRVLDQVYPEGYPIRARPPV
jgi:hypothetical protein